MHLQAKEIRAETGLYVHVPFCASTCDFCGFYQKKPHGDDFSRYLKAVELELGSYQSPQGVSTVFWGGGTPGLLGPTEMKKLGGLVRGFARDARIEEWTVEMAPAFVTDRKLRILRDMGVNRLSLGVQSFQEKTLDALGRQHTGVQVHRAIERVVAAGFENFNLDLIFAIPGQTVREWREDLIRAVSFRPSHISTYCLTFEEDTALFVKLSEGKVRIDPEREAEFYRITCETLEKYGYAQYEISNFSRPGFECIHNLNTWDMREWIGVGPSAASQYGNRRYANIPDLERWAEGWEHGRPVYRDIVELDREMLARDALIFGIRKNRGVRLREWAKRFNAESLLELLRPRFDHWMESGWVEGENYPEYLQLSLTGRLLADRLGVELLD